MYVLQQQQLQKIVIMVMSTTSDLQFMSMEKITMHIHWMILESFKNGIKVMET